MATAPSERSFSRRGMPKNGDYWLDGVRRGRLAASLHSAVAYLNQDVAADGPNFGAAGSPSSRATIRDVTQMIRNPDTPTQTVFEVWRSNATNVDSLGPVFGDPGGGSDFAGFANHLGIPIFS